MKKILRKSFLILVLLIIYIYVIAIDSIPDTITRFQGEELNLQTILGIKISNRNDEETMEVSSNERK